MADVRAPISLDGVAVHPDCWCVCLCYLHFAPENPEDGEMYLLVPAHPGCSGQSPQSRKMVVKYMAHFKPVMASGFHFFCTTLLPQILIQDWLTQGK